MALSLPRLLRRLGAALAHFQYALPLALPCPAVVTIHDLSFERDPSLMGRRDRLVFRRVVPRAARKAVRVLAVSERTRRDLRELYGVPDEKIVVTPNGVDPAFTPRTTAAATMSSSSAPSRSGRTRSRRSPPPKRPDCRSSSRGRPRTKRSRVSSSGAAPASPATSSRTSSSDLYRGAACLVQPSRYEGFGLPGARGDGVRHAGRRGAGAGAARGRGRRGRLGRGGRARGGNPASARRARAARRGGARARAPLFLGRDRARTLAVYREVLGR